MRGNLDEAVKVLPGIKADNYSPGTINGSGVDTLDYNELLLVVNSGINGSGGTADVKLQESDDDSSYSDISGAALTQITEIRLLSIHVCKHISV